MERCSKSENEQMYANAMRIQDVGKFRQLCGGEVQQAEKRCSRSQTRMRNQKERTLTSSFRLGYGFKKISFMILKFNSILDQIEIAIPNQVGGEG
jgi:hypothetical protein